MTPTNAYNGFLDGFDMYLPSPMPCYRDVPVFLAFLLSLPYGHVRRSREEEKEEKEEASTSDRRRPECRVGQEGCRDALRMIVVLLVWDGLSIFLDGWSAEWDAGHSRDLVFWIRYLLSRVCFSKKHSDMPVVWSPLRSHLKHPSNHYQPWENMRNL